MVSGFTKSPEAVKAFKDAGFDRYPEEMQDGLYETWIKETSAEYLSKYTKTPEKEIHQLDVRVVGTGEYTDEGIEGEVAYITYNYRHIRLDKMANITHRYVSFQGFYPKPVAHYETLHMDFGKEERKASYVEHVDKVYTLPYNKKNLLKLIKEIPLRKDPPASCSVTSTNGISMTIDTFKDLLDAADLPHGANLLMHFSHCPTEKEVQRYYQEGGSATDRMVMSQIARRSMDTIARVPEAPVTASQVQRMLDQQKEMLEQQHKQEIEKLKQEQPATTTT